MSDVNETRSKSVEAGFISHGFPASKGRSGNAIKTLQVLVSFVEVG